MKPVDSTHITLMISNMDASIKFYTEVLGFKLQNNYGGHYAEIAAPGQTIGLHPGGKPNQKNESMSIGFSVSDFDAWTNYLKEKGIETKLINDGWSRICEFQDSDGNKMYLAEKK